MSRPMEVKLVGGLLCYTLTRTMMARQLPSAKMFGGENADGWLGPWFSDTCLGILTPFAIYGAFTGKGVVAWGLLLSFNVLGSYDYANGLLAQYLHPQVTFMGDPAGAAGRRDLRLHRPGLPPPDHQRHPPAPGRIDPILRQDARGLDAPRRRAP